MSGKGGVGKTTLTVLLAKSFADEGKKVIVLDADPSPNLALALGLSEAERMRIVPIASMLDLIEERTGARPGESIGGLFNLNPKVDDLLDRFGYETKHGIRLLVLGALKTGGGGCYCPENSLLKALFKHLVVEREEAVIMDMEAGVEHLGRRTAENVDVMIIVVEPSLKSVEIAAQIRKLASDIGIRRVAVVANKLASKKEENAVRRMLDERGLELLGTLRYERAVVEGELKGDSILAMAEKEDLMQSVIEIKRKIEGKVN